MSDIFIGRQPIFDKNMNVFAYELLFRKDGQSTSADVSDADNATSQLLLNCFVEIGLENITGRHKAFINMTRLFIRNPEWIMAAPREQIYLVIGHCIEPSEENIVFLDQLIRSGFTLVLDAHGFDERLQPFLEMAQLVKLDTQSLAFEELETQVRAFRQYPVKLLATKAESYDEYESLKRLEFDFYQGNFFSRPKIVSSKTLDANQIAVLNLVARVNDPEVQVEELARLVSADVSLSYKILRFINSPVSGLRTQVTSIQQSVVLLGLATIKNWVTILALAEGSKKPTELGTTALVRARCCELISRQCKLPNPDAFFTVGLFSCLDAMMDQSLPLLLRQLPLSDESKMALLEHKGIYGQALNSVISMERSDFGLIGFRDLGLTELSDIYLQAIHWADEVLNSLL